MSSSSKIIAEDFPTTLQILFDTHLHGNPINPTADCSATTNHSGDLFDTLWTPRMVLPLASRSDKEILRIFTQLRELARRLQFSSKISTFFDLIFSFLRPENRYHFNFPLPPKLKLRMVQTMKNCLQRGHHHQNNYDKDRHKCITFFQCHLVLDLFIFKNDVNYVGQGMTTDDTTNPHSYRDGIENKILLQISTLISLKISPRPQETESVALLSKLKGCLDLPHISSRCRALISNILVESNFHQNPSPPSHRNGDQNQVVDDQSPPAENFHNKWGHQIITQLHTNLAWGQSGVSTGGREGHHQNSPKNVADAVRSQQAQVIRFKHHFSENTEIEQINLIKALNGSRARGGGRRNFSAQIFPATTKPGSDQSWIRNTAYEVENLLRIAEAGQVVKVEDVEYLRKKFCGEEKIWSFFARELEILTKVAKIFELASKRQEMTGEFLQQLAQKMFTTTDKGLDENWDECRLSILTTIDHQATRTPAIVAASSSSTARELHEILMDFKNSGEIFGCSKNMEFAIWKILNKDDANFESTFAGALDILRGHRGVLVRRDSSSGVKDRRERLRLLEEAIDSIEHQVWNELRCEVLEAKFKFAEKLVQIVLDNNDGYPLSIRVKVAQIVEDFLAHKNSKGLTQYWLQAFKARAISCLDSESEPAELIEVDEATECTEDMEMVKGKEKSNHEGVLASAVSAVISVKNMAVSAGVSASKMVPSAIVSGSKSAAKMVVGHGPVRWFRNAMEGSHAAEEDHKATKTADSVQSKFQKTLLRSILHSLNKKRTENENFGGDQEMMKFLVDMATRDFDLKLEVLIVACLRNLIKSNNNNDSQFGLTRDFNFLEKLTPKLTRQDVLIGHTTVQLEEELNEEKKEGRITTMEENDGRIFVSAIVAHILFEYVSQPVAPNLKQSTLTTLVHSVQSSVDPVTRVMCSKILYKISKNGRRSSGSGFWNEYILNALRDLCFDPLTDVKVYCTAALVSALTEEETPISAKILSFLPSLYLLEKFQLTLDSHDFTPEVNGSILRILEMASTSPDLIFPNQIFHLLAYILKEEDDDGHGHLSNDDDSVHAISLRIVHNYLEMRSSNEQEEFELPASLIQAIENMYLDHDHEPETWLWRICWIILSKISGHLGHPLSDTVLERLDEDLFSENLDLVLKSFRLLLRTNDNQELPPKIFDSFDLTLVTLKLAHFVHSVRENFYDDDLESKLKNSGLLKRELMEFGGFNFFKKEEDPSSSLLNMSCHPILVDRLATYAGDGHKLSPLTFDILTKCFSIPSNLHDVIIIDIRKNILDCLIQAVQNGQILPPTTLPVLQFDEHFPKHKMMSDPILHSTLQLAESLAINGQNVPAEFLTEIVIHFCLAMENPTQNKDDDPVLQQIVTIIENLSQNGHTTNHSYFPTQMVLMGLMRRWSQRQNAINYDDRHHLNSSEQIQILRTMACLLGQQNDVQFDEPAAIVGQLKKIFLEALHIFRNDSEILKMSLGALIILVGKWDVPLDEGDIGSILTVQYHSHDDEDIEMDPVIHDKIRQLLTPSQMNFDGGMELSKALEAVTSTAASGQTLDLNYNLNFCKNILFTLGDHHGGGGPGIIGGWNFMGTWSCQNKLQFILEHHSHNSEILSMALEILSKIQSNEKINVKPSIWLRTMEAVAFAMVNNEGHNVEIKKSCLEILEKTLNSKLKFSNKITQYLKTESILCAKILEPPASTPVQNNPNEMFEWTHQNLDTLDDPRIVQNYQKLIKQKKAQNVDHAHNTMANWLKNFLANNEVNEDHHCQDEKFVAILQCFFETINSSSTAMDSSKLPHETAQLLLTLVVHPTIFPWARKISFEILHRRLLKVRRRGENSFNFGKKIMTKLFSKKMTDGDELIKNFMGDGNDGSRGYIQALIYQIFLEIFDNDLTRAQKEMDVDSKFNLELLQILLSTTNCDLTSLKNIENRQDWRKHLVMANAVTNFASASSVDEKTSVYQNLSKIHQNFGDKGAEKILDFMMTSKKFRKCSPHTTLSILTSVVHFDLDAVYKIFQNFDDDDDSDESIEIFSQNLQMAVQLKEKINFQIISPQILLILAQRWRGVLVTSKNSVNDTFPHKLWSRIHTIESLDSFDHFIDVLNQFGHFFWEQSPQIEEEEDEEDEKMSMGQLTNVLLSQVLAHPLMFQPASQSEESKNGMMKERGGKKFQKLKRNLGSLLKAGISFQQLEKLFDCLQAKRDKEGGGQSLEFLCEKITRHLANYQIGSHLFAKILIALAHDDEEEEEPLKICLGVIHQEIFFGGQARGIKNDDGIFEELVTHNQHPPSSFSLNLSIDKLRSILTAVKDEHRLSHFCPNKKSIATWTPEDVKGWAECVQKMEPFDLAEDKGKEMVDQFYTESLIVTRRAIYLVKQFFVTTVQILCCYLTLTKNHEKGQLHQVATGSGKSTIIAIIAVIKAIERSSASSCPVDVYTSSPVLAQRDAKEWSKFYKLFGLTCDHNGDRLTTGNDGGTKACYSKNVVYGDTSQFQFDYLRDAYSDLGTLGGRQQRYAIVDEVDCMFIDDGSKLARLSSPLAGMELLQPLYFFLWDRLNHLQTHFFSLAGKTFYIEGQLSRGGETGEKISYTFINDSTGDLKMIEDLVDYMEQSDLDSLLMARIREVENVQNFVLTHLEDYMKALIFGQEKYNGEVKMMEEGCLKLPKNLLEFSRTQIPKWVESAIAAVGYRENVHYIVDEGQVKPVDFHTTGVIQSCTHWNNGLHQFLQIKHGLKLAPETVTTNFLSNWAMFQKYQGNLVGFTGTLGSKAGQSILAQMYNVNLVIMPDTHFRRHVQYPDLVCLGGVGGGSVDEEGRIEWLAEIVQSTLDEVKIGRGILIVAESIMEADLIKDALQRSDQSSKGQVIKLYTKNHGDQEKHVERIRPGDVIVATNLAGRGTDIKTVDIEKFGGLHVILTFLPTSFRVERQAFGRTSRIGNIGTSQLIICSNSTDFLRHRNESEKSQLENFQTAQLPAIQKKDELFQKFCIFYHSLRTQLKGQRKVGDKIWGFFGLHTQGLTPFELTVLQAVEERWTMFLRKVDDDSQIKLEEALDQYDDFEREVTQDQVKGHKALIQATHSPFYFIQLGNEEYEQDGKISQRIEAARQYFDLAIEMDSNFAAPAFVGIAYTFLKGQVHPVKPTSRLPGYKMEALKLMKKALPLLSQEMGLNTAIQAMVQKNQGGKMDSNLFRQFSTKQNLVGSYMKNVENVVAVVEKSLRPVHCTTHHKMEDGSQKIKIDNCYHKDKWLPKSTTNENNSVILEGQNIPWRQNLKNYHLTFNNLTVYEDSGTRDQAINTLNKLKDSDLKRPPKIYHQGAEGQTSEVEQPFKVGLSCWPLTVEKVKEENFQKKFATFCQILKTHDAFLNLELLSLDPLTLKSIMMTSNLGDVKDDKNTPENWSKSFSLEVKNFGKDEEVKLKKFSIQNVGHLEIELDTEICGAEFPSNPLKSVKWNRLQKNQVITTLSKLSPSSPYRVHLTLVDMELENFEQILSQIEAACRHHNCQSQCPDMILHFTQMNPKLAKKGVKFLRSLDNIEFSLHVTDLSFIEAQSLITKADLGQEEMEQMEVKNMDQLFLLQGNDDTTLPLSELKEFNGRGLSLLATFNERRFVPWISIFSVCALGAFQMAAGGVLISTGFGATVGLGLITEGSVDFVTAFRAYSVRQFSWTEYGVYKGVSLAISAASCGLQGLKGGFKGAKSLFQGAVSEGIEQAGTRVVVSTTAAGGTVVAGETTLQATIQSTGKNLTQLALKQIAISGTETGVRIGLNAFTDTICQFSMDQLKPNIVDRVGTEVRLKFVEANFKKILSRHQALHKFEGRQGNQGVERKISKILDHMGHSKSAQMWTSLGTSLCAGLLSDTNFVGGVASLLARATTVVMGVREIVTVVDKVCLDIVHDFTSHDDDHQHSVAWALHSQQGMELERAMEVVGFVRFGAGCGSGRDFQIVQHNHPRSAENSHDFDRLLATLRQLDEFQQEFLGDDTNAQIYFNQLCRQVADAITHFIVQVSNSHLISPLTTLAVGKIVAAVSTEIQHRFICPPTTALQKIRDKPANQRTKEEKSLLRQYDGTKKNTVRKQILNNAAVYVMAHERREIIAKAEEAIIKMKSGHHHQQSTEKDQFVEVIKVAGNEPADLAKVIMMKEQNGLTNVRITGDPNYQLTAAEIEGGVKLIYFEMREDGRSKFVLKSSEGQPIQIFDGGSSLRGTQDSGYDIMSHLTEKSIDQLRLELAKGMMNDQTFSTDIGQSVTWILGLTPAAKKGVRGTAEFLRRANNIIQNVRTISGTVNSMAENVATVRNAIGWYHWIREQWPLLRAFYLAHEQSFQNLYQFWLYIRDPLVTWGDRLFHAYLWLKGQVDQLSKKLEVILGNPTKILAPIETFRGVWTKRGAGEGNLNEEIYLVKSLTVQFPLHILARHGTHLVENEGTNRSQVAEMVRRMNEDNFLPPLEHNDDELAWCSDLRSVEEGIWFVVGHLQSPAYGGVGSDRNCIPMTMTLRALAVKIVDDVMEKLRFRFPHSQDSKVRMSVKVHFRNIKSRQGGIFSLAEKIRFSLTMADLTGAELDLFEREFCGKNNSFTSAGQNGRVELIIFSLGQASIIPPPKGVRVALDVIENID